MAIGETVVVFVVSLIIGALGIYVGSRLITGTDDYIHAVVSALLASLVWVIVAIFFGWIPFLGPLLALVAYLAVINRRYPGGWMNAAGIAVIAWAFSLLILYVLATMGITSLEAVGIPGV